MKIQILGTGCAKCNKLAENAKKAAQESGISFEVEKITDMKQIMAMGVMMTPALAVDGKIKVVGKIPSPDEIKKLLK
ncbi:MAG: thioredoxin family protein [Desulforegulaceae bacterium]|nr:thioredoxin family protein [Desulforegulaceae bacterium]